MKASQAMQWAGLGLLAAAFALSAGRLLVRSGPLGDDGRTLRFAHWRLEEPTVAALDELAREYERRHPGWRVEQLPIPLRAWRAWLQTQLVGGTAPDLIVAGHGVNDETLARHFRPISEHVDAPNPYNAGTPLADLPWRDTFVDGMASPNYNANLLEFFAAPISGNTFRLFYNLDLIESLTGQSEPPADLASLERLAAAASEWSERQRQPLVTLAGAFDRSLPLFERLISWQMQTNRAKVDRNSDLQVQFSEQALGYLEGRWRLDEGPPRQALEIVRLVGQMHQPGYLGQRQDDALFLFLQQRAVATIGASWDAANIRRLAPFRVVVADLPFPAPDDPRFGGPGVRRTSEATTAMNLSFGLTRASRHPERALDFLQFLTSQPANAHFMHRSGNIPAVVGVEPAEDQRVFLPVAEGAIGGGSFVYSTSTRGDTNHVYETSLHALTNPGGTVEAFLERFVPAYREALRRDLQRDVRNVRTHVRRLDSLLGCAGREPDEAARRLATFFQTQNAQEAQAARLAWQLANVSETTP
jgi:raffinose/stachyose/melibiose transport system substrate-binding protein